MNYYVWQIKNTLIFEISSFLAGEQMAGSWLQKFYIVFINVTNAFGHSLVIIRNIRYRYYLTGLIDR